MVDSFVILLIVGIFAIAAAAIGLKRGKAVVVFHARRDRETSLFWYCIVFQLGLGIVATILAFVVLFAPPQ